MNTKKISVNLFDDSDEFDLDYDTEASKTDFPIYLDSESQNEIRMNQRTAIIQEIRDAKQEEMIKLKEEIELQKNIFEEMEEQRKEERREQLEKYRKERFLLSIQSNGSFTEYSVNQITNVPSNDNKIIQNPKYNLINSIQLSPIDMIKSQEERLLKKQQQLESQKLDYERKIKEITELIEQTKVQRENLKSSLENLSEKETLQTEEVIVQPKCCTSEKRVAQLLTTCKNRSCEGHSHIVQFKSTEELQKLKEAEEHRMLEKAIQQRQQREIERKAILEEIRKTQIEDKKQMEENIEQNNKIACINNVDQEKVKSFKQEHIEEMEREKDAQRERKEYEMKQREIREIERKKLLSEIRKNQNAFPTPKAQLSPAKNDFNSNNKSPSLAQKMQLEDREREMESLKMRRIEEEERRNKRDEERKRILNQIREEKQNIIKSIIDNSKNAHLNSQPILKAESIVQKIHREELEREIEAQKQRKIDEEERRRQRQIERMKLMEIIRKQQSDLREQQIQIQKSQAVSKTNIKTKFTSSDVLIKESPKDTENETAKTFTEEINQIENTITQIQQEERTPEFGNALLNPMHSDINDEQFQPIADTEIKVKDEDTIESNQNIQVTKLFGSSSANVSSSKESVESSSTVMQSNDNILEIASNEIVNKQPSEVTNTQSNEIASTESNSNENDHLINLELKPLLEAISKENEMMKSILTPKEIDEKQTENKTETDLISNKETMPNNDVAEVNQIEVKEIIIEKNMTSNNVPEAKLDENTIQTEMKENIEQTITNEIKPKECIEPKKLDENVADIVGEKSEIDSPSSSTKIDDSSREIINDDNDDLQSMFDKKSILAEMRRINQIARVSNRKTVNLDSKMTEIELKHNEEIQKHLDVEKQKNEEEERKRVQREQERRQMLEAIRKQKEEAIPKSEEKKESESNKTRNISKAEMLSELRRNNRLASLVKNDASFNDQLVVDQKE